MLVEMLLLLATKPVLTLAFSSVLAVSLLLLPTGNNKMITAVKTLTTSVLALHTMLAQLVSPSLTSAAKIATTIYSKTISKSALLTKSDQA
jgi:hypothetical protein